MRIRLPYDVAGLSACDIPDGRLSAIYRMAETPAVSDLDREIRAALDRPIGCPRLSALVRSDQRVAVIVDDLTRPTPTARILPGVLEALHDRGVRREQISVVVALGSHRPMTAAEIRKKVGDTAAADYRVVNSRFDDPAHLVDCGRSADGVPIWIDEAVARADLRIGIGSIVPHGAVGWSGGAKILYPGVAGKETVARFHFTHGLTEENMTGREACPVRARMEAWVQQVGLEFVVNCVLTPDDAVSRVVAGHYVAAQRAGVAAAKPIYCREIREQVDIVVSVGYVHDGDFWQASKGLYGPEALVRDGGTLLLVAPCSEGIGPHADYLERIGRDDNRAILEAILDGRMKEPPDPLSLGPAGMMARLRRRFRAAIVSPGLGRHDLDPAGYEKFDDVESGVATLLHRYPLGRVAVVLRSDLAFLTRA